VVANVTHSASAFDLASVMMYSLGVPSGCDMLLTNEGQVLADSIGMSECRLDWVVLGQSILQLAGMASLHGFGCAM
jgi:hypothetical protein